MYRNVIVRIAAGNLVFLSFACICCAGAGNDRDAQVLGGLDIADAYRVGQVVAVVVCEAIDEARIDPARDGPEGIRGMLQRFRIGETLAGDAAEEKEATFRYAKYGKESGKRNDPVIASGDHVIWILHTGPIPRPDAENRRERFQPRKNDPVRPAEDKFQTPLSGVVWLMDTPENRKAVVDPTVKDRGWGPAVEGVEISLRPDRHGASELGVPRLELRVYNGGAHTYEQRLEEHVHLEFRDRSYQLERRRRAPYVRLAPHRTQSLWIEPSREWVSPRGMKKKEPMEIPRGDCRFKARVRLVTRVGTRVSGELLRFEVVSNVLATERK